MRFAFTTYFWALAFEFYRPETINSRFRDSSLNVPFYPFGAILRSKINKIWTDCGA